MIDFEDQFTQKPFLKIYDKKPDEKLSLVIIVDTAVTSSFGWKGL